MLRQIFTAAAFVAYAAAAPLDTASQFAELKAQHGRDYATPALEQAAFEAMQLNLQEIERLSAENPNAEFGLNKFFDMSKEQFAATHLTYKSSDAYENLSEVELPEEYAPQEAKDWTGVATTPVKDQGQCGSCWAFSATEQIESIWMQSKGCTMGKGKGCVLAPQQITSCDKVDKGCQGGDTLTAYKYVEKAGGLESAYSMPYKSGKSGKNGACKFEKSKVVANIAEGMKVSAKKEAGMRQYVDQTSPLSICIDASSWQNYKSGILQKCGKQLDHCVQIAGFDTASGAVPAWKVRNSWNTDWGEKGFIRLEMGKDMCGITTEPTTVKMAKSVEGELNETMEEVPVFFEGTEMMGGVQ